MKSEPALENSRRLAQTNRWLLRCARESSVAFRSDLGGNKAGSFLKSVFGATNINDHQMDFLGMRPSVRRIGERKADAKARAQARACNLYRNQIRFAKNISARHLLGVSTVKEIERAVEQLLPKDFAKLSAWMKKHKSGAKRSRNGNSANGGADWFDVYMACPRSFEIPPRKKQFYKPKA